MSLQSFAIFLSAAGIMTAIGHLTTVPKNTVARLGTRVELECRTDAKIPVRWNFSPAGSQNNTFIYYSGYITYKPKDKYAVNNSPTGRYNLIMNSVDLSFAGTYTCSDTPGGQQSTRLSSSAELIVIVADPVCRTNASAVVVEGDYIQIVCTVNYNGNWLPVMKCNKSSGWNINANTTYTSSMSSLLTQLTLDDNGVTFTCNTTFKPMSTRNRNRTEVDKDDSVPDYHHSWKFIAHVSDETTVIGQEKTTLAKHIQATPASSYPATIALPACGVLATIGLIALALGIALTVKSCLRGNSTNRERPQETSTQHPDYEMVDESEDLGNPTVLQSTKHEESHSTENIDCQGYSTLKGCSSAALAQPAVYAQLQLYANTNINDN